MTVIWRILGWRKSVGANPKQDQQPRNVTLVIKLSSEDLLRLQQEQFRHDQRNHSDIWCLPKTDRLKHYGLHFAKYVGRIARGADEAKSVERTIVDTALVCLSAANVLHQHLHVDDIQVTSQDQIDPLRNFADAAGRFADACEKIDHLEEFLPIARKANGDVLSWVVASCNDRRFDLEEGIRSRRKELAARQFFIAD